jgi:hypothetical protein
MENDTNRKKARIVAVKSPSPEIDKLTASGRFSRQLRAGQTLKQFSMLESYMAGEKILPGAHLAQASHPHP